MKRPWKPTVAAHNLIVKEMSIGAKYLSTRTAEKVKHMSVW